MLLAGGGHWTLFGLGLSLKLKITVTNVTADLAPFGVTQEVIDARDNQHNDRVARLFALHNDEGVPTHFDLAVDAGTAGAEVLGTRSTTGQPEPHPALTVSLVAVVLMLLPIALACTPLNSLTLHRVGAIMGSCSIFGPTTSAIRIAGMAPPTIDYYVANFDAIPSSGRAAFA